MGDSISCTGQKVILVKSDVVFEETLFAIDGLGMGRIKACCPDNSRMNNKYIIPRVTEKY